MPSKFYKTTYSSPLGEILLIAEGETLIGLFLPDQPSEKYLKTLPEIPLNKEPKILQKTKNWLSRYFSGENPDLEELKLNPKGTDFRKAVWKILEEIPYGEIKTYGEVATELKNKLGKKNMSARAVGSAVGKNPISIIIPCHRIIGKNGALTGYTGGLDKKIKLLELEGIIKA